MVPLEDVLSRVIRLIDLSLAGLISEP